MIVNFFWITLLLIVAIFLVLGILVIMGLKKEVSNFLDIILEGSLTIIDAFDLIKKLYTKFIEILKDFLYFIAPVISMWIAIMIYIGILFLYKGVGKENDVTILTTVLTVAMVVAVGILNRPVQQEVLDTWTKQIRKRFKDYFADSFEIIIFVFFLTMDSTKLFFIPANLNVPLRSSLFGYDLMLRGADVTNQVTVTIFLVTAGISIEIIRNIIKLIALAIQYYKEMPKRETKILNIKESVRLSFVDAKDDLIKFIAFTTTLILVFLIFPRLKLYAMLITSLTGLLLDIGIPGRMSLKRTGTDLITRTLNKIFRL